LIPPCNDFKRADTFKVEKHPDLTLNKTAVAKRIRLLRYLQAQEHPGSKARGNTRRKAARSRWHDCHRW
jgi:hypothetical protein